MSKKKTRYIQLVDSDGTTYYESVIYCYTLKSTNQHYVGQTCDETARRNDWNRASCNYGGMKIHLARLNNGISAEVWQYSILERVKSTELAEITKKSVGREKYWIGEKDSFYHGFNGNKGGAGLNGVEMSQEQRNKISASRKNAVVVTTADGKVTEYSSEEAAASALNVSRSTVSRFLKSGKTHPQMGFSISKK